MRWLLSLALVQVTARRLVHLNGSYHRALFEADAAGHRTNNERRLHLGPEPPADAYAESGSEDPQQPSSWGQDVLLQIDAGYSLPDTESFDAKLDREVSGPSLERLV
jgi:hypothetical protein